MEERIRLSVSFCGAPCGRSDQAIKGVLDGTSLQASITWLSLSR